MENGNNAEGGNLATTPTWVVAAVCLTAYIICCAFQRIRPLVATFWNKIRKKSLIKPIEKIKSELTPIGLIIVFLVVAEDPLSRICISTELASSFLPCTNTVVSESKNDCEKQGKKSLLSSGATGELQSLIIIIAFSHTISSLIIIGLGMAKAAKWKSWEADAQRFRIERHGYWSQNRLLKWLVYFLQQFCGSVHRVDYFNLRRGFILVSNYNFPKHIRRTLKNSFEEVAGISFWIWIFSVLNIFFHAEVFERNLWPPVVPFVVLLIVGTKLQGVLNEMCLNSEGTFHVRQVKHFFWFGKSKVLLHIIHFVIFQTSVQVAFLFWTWYNYGVKSCFNWQTKDILLRIVGAVLVLLLGGYVTLPVYALVTQMDSSRRQSEAAFTETVVKGLRRWRNKARTRRNRESSDVLLHNYLSEVSPSQDSFTAVAIDEENSSEIQAAGD